MGATRLEGEIKNYLEHYCQLQEIRNQLLEVELQVIYQLGATLLTLTLLGRPLEPATYAATV